MTRHLIHFATLLFFVLIVSDKTAMAQFELSEPEPDASETTAPAKPEKSKPRAETQPNNDESESEPRSRGLTFENAPTSKPNSPRTATKKAAVSVAAPVVLIDEDSPKQPFFSGPVLRSKAIGEDATLNDVCHVGSRCYAVGERGVICCSADGGESWTTRFMPFECSLKSVCFLTNTIGWVAGVRVLNGTSQQAAVLLHTRDGGLTWQDISVTIPLASNVQAIPTSSLPGIVHVQFFGLETAIALTLPARDLGGDGIFKSTDGGQTWTAIPPDQRGGSWTAAHFLSESEGVFVGGHQSYGVLVANQAVVVNATQATLRQMRGVSLSPDGEGWIVGDGSSILTTSNAGVTWQPPGQEVPTSIADLADLHTVAHQGSVVLLAGNPGSFILRSESAGNEWQSHAIPATGRISRLRFLTDTDVLAVGSLGQILRSSDAGVSWQVVRSAKFRSGILNFVTDADHAAWQLLASASAEDGVRSTVLQLSQPLDLSRSSINHGPAMMTTRTQQAVTQLGGNDTASDWMFPRTKPEHHRSPEQLIAEWNRQTDGRLRRLLPLRLARDIRNWRPTVVVIEPTSDDDAVAAILRDVIQQSVNIARADGTNDSDSGLSQVGLEPWSVDRMVARVSSDRTAPLSFDDADLLSSSGTTIGLLCDAATRVVSNGDLLRSVSRNRARYEILFDAKELAAVPKLFAGIEQALTAESRRRNTPRPREDVAALGETLQSAHLESSALAGHLAMNAAEGSLDGQLREIGQNLPQTLALKQLRDLADLNLQRNNMEGYLAVQQEITRRFPSSEDAHLAAEMLFVFYSSTEARHYRIRSQFKRSQPHTKNPDAGSETTAKPAGDLNIAVKPIGQRPEMQSLSSGASSQLAALQQRWDSHAAMALKILSEQRTEEQGGRDLSPLIRLRVAANFRKLERSGDLSNILSDVSQRNDEFGIFARSEMQLTAAPTGPLPVFNLPRRSEQPFLDGKLTDSIWEEAIEIPLAPFTQRSESEDGVEISRSSQRNNDEPSSLAMIAWDDEFLYISARLERSSAKPNPIELATHRSHDARHDTRDRFEFEFDTDRDFSTSFLFCVDESGLTSERCWMLQKWNPRWFVAIDSDESTWRLEAAIPLAELGSPIAKPGDLWAMRLRRVIPGVLQHELLSTSSSVSTNGTGLIRFIRPKVLSGN